MTKPIVRDPIYRKRVFDADIIELCVRWGTVSILGVRCHKACTWTASDLRRNRGYHSRNRASSFPSSTAQRT
jgi:hypothetical protein